MAKLEPCPFCGSKNVVDVGDYVECMSCDAMGPDGNEETDGVTAWNTRTPAKHEDK